MKLKENTSKFERISTIFEQMTKRPFLTTIILCILLFPIGMCQLQNIEAKDIFYEGILCAVIGGIFIYKGKIEKEKNLIILMIAIGVLFRYTYVLSVNSFVCQHDVGMFTGTAGGHSNYIEYWYNNGLKLPDFDVRQIWQFYHPPFHHYTMSLLLKFFTMIGIEYGKACQALQILPFIYSSLCMVVIYKIFKFVKLKSTPLIISMAIVCFHPTFITLAGYFNNDTLSVLFMLLSVMFALRWYQNPVMKNIIPIALCIGLGMMTKLSAWMVAPAIAIFFIYVFVKNIKDWFKYIIQFIVFGIVCVPLGIWWPVRSLIKFNIPLNYVPDLGEGFAQYLGRISASERLFSFGNGQLSSVFLALGRGGLNYYEYNPTIGLFKTAMFDENIPSEPSTFTSVTTSLLFWSSVILVLICFISFIVMMVRRKSEIKGIERVFFGLLMFVPLISYYIFCFSYPYTCTQNIRYCVIVIPLCAMGLGLMLQNMKENEKTKYIKRVIYILVAVFCAMSFTVFTQIDTIVPQ